MPRALARALAVADRLGAVAAALGAVALVALLAVMLFEVVARYGFDRPTVWGGDLATMLNGSLWLLGAALALREGRHIRIDFLASRLPTRLRSVVDAIFYACLLLPVLALLSSIAWARTVRAFSRGEIDLAMAWKVPIWPFYAVIALALTVVALQVAAEMGRHASHLLADRPTD